MRKQAIMLNNTKLVKVFRSGLPQGELGDKERAASAAAIQGFVPKVSLTIASHMTIHSLSLKESIHNGLLRNRSSNIHSNDNNMLCIALLFVGQVRASRGGQRCYESLWSFVIQLERRKPRDIKKG